MLLTFSRGARDMKRVTLRDVAAEVGLSTFAVSRALSGKAGVSEATRAQVVQAATRIGYARPPGAEEGRDIALVFHDLDDANAELRMQIQDGVQREAQRLGSHIRLRWTHVSGQ